MIIDWTDEENIEALNQAYLDEIAELEKVPDDPTVSKQYVIGCHNAADWQYIHHVLITEGTGEADFPSNSVQCIDACNHSPTRGRYILTDEEADTIKNHPKVWYIHPDFSRYQGTYKPPTHEIICSAKYNRYNSNRRQYRDMQASMPYTPTDAEAGRSGYQLSRCMQVDDPWWSETGTYLTKNDVVLNQKIQQFGDGSDVDLIITDTEAWYGHPEFINTAIRSTATNDGYNSTGSGPSNYRGGNRLPGNGYCDVLDVYLDAPYLIDRDFFDADAGNRLTTRWDGTIVPQESIARAWWASNSLSARSSKFVSPSNGGTATGLNDFGVINSGSQWSGYTRARCNGSNTAYCTGSATHATQCMGVSYGRSYGWAYNANKWHINNIGTNAVSIEGSADLIKVLHNCKPNNSSFGTKDPTVTSNSWGYRSTSHYNVSSATPVYIFFRHGQGQTGTVANSSASYTSSSTMPNCIRDVGRYGDGDRMKGEMLQNSMVTAWDEMVDAGVITVVASGNSNQKQVQPNHPDFDNFWTSGTATNTNLTSHTHLEFSISCYNTMNRPGFPQQVGRHTDSNGNLVLNKVINMGALDHAYQTTGHERKVNYSDMGNGIDCYTPADDAMGPTRGSSYSEGIHPETYPGLSVTAYDDDFGGTSSACPVAAGMIATKLQYNRAWLWSDVKTWILNLTQQDPNKFYVGTEATTVNDTNWLDTVHMNGGSPIVMYDKATGQEPSGAFGSIQSSNYTITEGDTLTVTIYAAGVPSATYYYSVEGIPGEDFTPPAGGFNPSGITGNFSYSGAGNATFDIVTTTDLITATEETARIRIRIRENAVNGPIVATTDDIIVNGTADPVPFQFASGGAQWGGGVIVTFQP